MGSGNSSSSYANYQNQGPYQDTPDSPNDYPNNAGSGGGGGGGGDEPVSGMGGGTS
jgi:hypothetical protein